MDPQTQEMLRAAEQAVAQLVERCRQDGALCRHSPRTVAWVGRTSRWLLYALAALQRSLTRPADDHAPPS